MRRPLFVVGISLLVTMFICGFLSEGAAPALGIAALAICIAAVILKNHHHMKLISAVSFAVAAGAFMFFITSLLYITPANTLDAQKTEIIARVDGLTEVNGNYQKIPVASNIQCPDGKIRNFKFYITTDADAVCRPCDIITCEVEFSRIPTDQAHYLYSDGIYVNAFCDGSVSIIDTGAKTVSYFASICREKIINSIEENLTPDTAALTLGICLGDTSNTSASIKNDFRACSLNHLMSVSGLHTTFVGIFILAILLGFRMKPRAASIVSMGIVWFFVLLAGCKLPAIRAAIMFSVMVSGRMARRQSDSLNSLGAASLLICCFIPFSAMDYGFLCSVCATFGVIVFTDSIFAFFSRPFKNRRIFKFLKPMLSAAAMSVAATSMILPILVCVFGSFSFVSILANAVVTPFAFLIVIGGLLGGFLYAFPILRFIAYPLLLIAGIVAKYFIFIISLLARIPFASVYSRYGAIYFWLLIFYSALLYAIFRRKRLGFLRRSFVTLICFICCVSLVLCCAATVFIQFNTFEVIAFDCSGELAVAVIRDKNIALFGCSRNGSGTYHITSALSYRGISRLDYFVLTENSSRFGAQQIASEIPVNTLLVSDSNKQMQLFMENETAFIKNTASLPTGPIRLFGNTTLEMPEDASYAIVRNNDISVLISDSAIPDGQYSISILPDSKTYGDKLLSPITIFYGDTTPAYSTEHSTVLSSHGGSIIIKTIFSYTSIRRIVDG